MVLVISDVLVLSYLVSLMVFFLHILKPHVDVGFNVVV